jgi:acetyltransferase
MAETGCLGRASVADIFGSRSVAVVGASSNPNKSGTQILKNLLDFGFDGEVYAVNPKGVEVLGLVAYPSVSQIPREVDLATISTPSEAVPQLVQECANKGIRAVVINTEGFAEIGTEGQALQAELEQVITDTGIRVIGPNALGIINPSTKLTTSYAKLPQLKRGRVACVGQSGIFTSSLLRYIFSWETFGLSKAISLGNKVDVDEAEVLDYLASDEETEVIAMYLEGVKDGRLFLESARRAAAQKPVVILKGGVTERGAQAARSHTGSLAGRAEVFKAAAKQSGIIVVDDLREFINTVKAFALQPLPHGNRVAIVTASGAEGIIATDACIRHGLKLARLSPKTTRSLLETFKEPSKVCNPVDIFPALLYHGRDKVYRYALSGVLADEAVDAAIVIGFVSEEVKVSLESLVEPAESQPQKPVLVTFLGSRVLTKYKSKLEGQGIPTYIFAEEAVQSLANTYRYSNFIEEKKLEHQPAYHHSWLT